MMIAVSEFYLIGYLNNVGFRLNIGKYAGNPAIAKVIIKYYSSQIQLRNIAILMKTLFDNICPGIV